MRCGSNGASAITRPVRRRANRRTSLGFALIAASLVIAGVAMGFAADATHEPAMSQLDSTLVSFRLGSVDGQPLRPDRANLAGRTDVTGPLLLFLAATGHAPADYRRFAHTALGMGYHVLMLDFPNLGRSVSATCANNSDCFDLLQHNRFDGARPSRFSSVSPSNSILSRLGAALGHLRHVDRRGGWGRFSSADGTIEWADVVVAGHSQGGGIAAWIAHHYRVQGGLFFSSPILVSGSGRATWPDTQSATDPARLFGLVDERDRFTDEILESWRALGIGATRIAGVETRGPSEPSEPGGPGAPSGPGARDAHGLVSTMLVGDASAAHLHTSIDLQVDDEPTSSAFEPVWKWMLAQVRTGKAEA